MTYTAYDMLEADARQMLATDVGDNCEFLVTGFINLIKDVFFRVISYELYF